MRRTMPAIAVLGLGLSFTLSGCFANPLEGITEGIIEGGVEQIIEDQTGVDVNANGGSLPDGWPTDVPVPPGDIIFSAATQGTFSATITVASPSLAEDAYQDLLANGYTETTVLDLGNGSKSLVAENATSTVNVLIAANEDGTATAQVTVTPKAP